MAHKKENKKGTTGRKGASTGRQSATGAGAEAGQGATDKAEQKATLPVVPVEKKKVYSFDSKLRCRRPNKSYPAFIRSKRCGAIMQSVRIIGDMKRWKCPVCGNVVMTKGKEV